MPTARRNLSRVASRNDGLTRAKEERDHPKRQRTLIRERNRRSQRRFRTLLGERLEERTVLTGLYLGEVIHLDYDPRSIAIGDLNGDGIMDIVTSSGTYFLGGQADGSFSEEHKYGESDADSVTLGDVNGDGLLDIVTADEWSGVHVFTQIDGGESVSWRQDSYDVGSYIRSVVLKDITGNGHLDIFAMGSTAVEILFNTGDGDFEHAITYRVGAFLTSMTVGDVNASGLPDIVVVRSPDDWNEPDSLTVHLNQGNGQFELAAEYFAETSQRIAEVVLGDINGDGRNDIVEKDERGYLSLRFGIGDGTFAGPESLDREVSGFTLGNVMRNDQTQIVHLVTNQWDIADKVGVLNYHPDVERSTYWSSSTAWRTDDDSSNERSVVLVEDMNGDDWSDVVIIRRGEIEPNVWKSSIAVFFNGGRPERAGPLVAGSLSFDIREHWATLGDEFSGGGTRFVFDQKMKLESELLDKVSVDFIGGVADLFEWRTSWEKDTWIWDSKNALEMFPRIPSERTHIPAGDYTYQLTVGPEFFDVYDRPMDQNRNGVAGEASDRYQTTTTVTVRPPRVNFAWPRGQLIGPVDRIDVYFTHNMDADSFDPSDIIHFTGPSGTITVTEYDWPSPRKLELAFPAQTDFGDYELILAPSILDRNGNALDNNGDGIPGQDPEDRYIATFTIPVPDGAPYVVAHTPTDGMLGPVELLQFMFSKPMDPESFSVSEDIVSFIGPDGPVDVTGYRWIDSRNLELTFVPQTAIGEYVMIVGPDIHDTSGNAMDQDRDGTPGEPIDDQYTATFSIVPPPKIVDHSPGDTVVGWLYSITLEFDQAMDIARFELADIVRFVAPDDAVQIVEFEWSNEQSLQLMLDRAAVQGFYELVVGPGLYSIHGYALDQDGNGVLGEPEDDWYVVTFVVDTPPRVLVHEPEGSRIAPLSSFRFTFDQSMDTEHDLALEDIAALTGPLGSISVVGASWIDDVTLEVTFDPQIVPGTYEMILGPHVLDATGNAMDQNANGTFGEVPEDQYIATTSVPAPPRIITHNPSGSAIAPVSSIQFEFDREMDPESFSVAEDIVGFQGPTGLLEVTDFRWVDEKTLELLFPPQVAGGLYELVIGPGIRDVLGNPMDQNGNFIAGELLEDRYLATFDVLTGPRILHHVPTGDQVEPVSEVIVTFSEPIDATTFTAEDVVIEGPLGQVNVLGQPAHVVDNSYRIRFPEQSSYGTYHVYVGPNIANARGTLMDQDRDGIPGELIDDRYDAGFRIIDVHGPRIVGHSPANPTNGQLDHADVFFNEAIRADTFDTSDVRIVGPLGEIAVSDVEMLTPERFRIHFPAQSAEGIYSVTVGPMIADLAGNWMDQDQDGLKGEPDDRYLAELVIDLTGPRILEHAPSGVQHAAVRVVQLVFSEPIDPASFTADLVTIDGPAGSYGALAVLPIAPDRFHVTIPPKLYDGTFRVSIAPEISDLAGNLLDQDQNDEQGQAEHDTYVFDFVQELPDLIVSAIVHPNEWVGGHELEIEWTVTNVGTGPAMGAWTDTIYLSSDDTIGNDVSLDSISFSSPLMPGESYTRIVTVLLPDQVDANRWFVIVTDAEHKLDESDETNNSKVSDSPIWVTMRPFPDLQVTSLTAPQTLSIGEEVTISWTVKNFGTAATDATYWHDGVFLSPTGELDLTLGGYVRGTQIWIGEALNRDFLDVGEEYTQSVSVQIPETTLSGDYYIVIKTDYRDRVSEFLLEDNNTITSQEKARVTAPGPGFLEVVAMEGPLLVEPGGTIGLNQLTWTIQNTGEATVSSRSTQGFWDDGVALSRDEVYQATEDYWLGGHIYYHMDPIGPGEVRTASNDRRQLRLPNWEPGDYFLILVPDTHWIAGTQGGLVPKSNGVLPIRLGYLDPPDLEVLTVVAPDAAVAGQEMELTWEVANRGEGPTRATKWTDAVYLSVDPTLGHDAVLVGVRTHTGTLEAGESYAATSISVTIPRSIPAGEYYVLVKADSENDVFESNEGNNVLATLGKVTIERIDADLIVTDVVGPKSGIAGQPIELTWTILNQGPDATPTDRWIDAVYLSTETTLNMARDTRIFSHPRLERLLDGASYSVTVTVTLPARIEGEYHLFIVTDADDELYEPLGEDNNVFRLADPITIVDPAPNLEILELIVPTVGVAGQPIVMDWLVQNVGEADANTEWSDAVFLSSESDFDPASANLLATFQHGESVIVGETYRPTSAPVTVTLPARIEGVFYLHVVANHEQLLWEKGRLSNNVITSELEIEDHAADLRVTSGSVEPQGIAGQFVAVDFIIANEGRSEATGSWHDAVFLSSDTTFDPENDRLFGLFERSTSLGVEEQYGPPTQPAYLRLPERIEGTYYVFIVTDYFNTVYEKDGESNNVYLVPDSIDVTLAAADLQVTGLLAPVEAKAGTVISVQWTVTNTGAVATDETNWQDGVYLSMDLDFSPPSDIELGILPHSGRLDPGESYTQVASFELRQDLSGPFYIYVFTDARRQVFEHDGEDNNITAADEPILINRVLADLQVSELIASSDPIAGQLMEVQWTVINAGRDATPATHWLDTVYLSNDPVLDDSDLPLGTFPRNGRLSSGETYTQTRQVQLPEAQTGLYYLIVKTDSSPRNDVFEYEAEDNNTRSIPLEVHLAPVPDLQVASIEIPATGWSSQELLVEWTVTNAGAAPASIWNGWWDSVYLSRDPYLDKKRDISLGSVQRIGADAPDGGVYTAQLEARLPPGLTGPYYILVMTDSTDRIFEREGENNNVRVSTSTLQINLTPPADLVVTRIRVPETAIYGDFTRWEFEVTNQGESDAVGQWLDTVYLSTDPHWDLDDLRVTRIWNYSHDTLPGGSYTVSPSAIVPPVLPGEYYVIVRTDILNNVRETNLENNLLVSGETVRVSGRSLSLGESVSGQIGRERSLYYEVELTAGEDLSVVLSGIPAEHVEVFVAFERLPTRSDFDSRGEDLVDGGRHARIPQTAEGTYYILLYGRSTMPAPPPTFTLTAAVLDFALEEVSPASAGNSGSATVKIHGTRMPDVAEVALLSPTGERIVGQIAPFNRDPSAITVTFDLTGVLPGTYHVEVIDLVTDDTAQLIGEFQVKDTSGWVAGPDDFRAEISLPAVIRTRGNQTQHVEGFIRYTNTSDHDIPSSLLTLTASNGGTVSLKARDGNAQSVLQILAINPDGPVGVLPSGSSFTIPVHVTLPPGVNVEVTVRSLGAHPGDGSLQPIDWNSHKSSMRPDGLGHAEWEELFNKSIEWFGATWDNYVLRLVDAAHFTLVTDRPRHDVKHLVNVSMQLLNSSDNHAASFDNQGFTVASTGTNAGASLYSPLTEIPNSITSPFGWRAYYNRNGVLIISPHDGIDFGYPEQTPLYPVMAGDGWTASFKGYQNLYGYEVLLRDGTLAFVYSHLHPLTSNPIDGPYNNGDRTNVAYDEIIAYSGSSGGNYDPHLHLRITTQRGIRPPLAARQNPLVHLLALQDSQEPTIEDGPSGTGKGFDDNSVFMTLNVVANSRDLAYATVQLVSINAQPLAYYPYRRELTVHPSQTDANLKLMSLPGSATRWSTGGEKDGNEFRQGIWLKDLPDADQWTFLVTAYTVHGVPGSGFFTYVKEQTPFPPDPGGEVEDTDSTSQVGSQDPNDKISSVGYGDLGYIRGDNWVPYTIRFENLPEATAAAQLVTIADQLDPSLDWTTFELGDMHFGDTFIKVPEGLQFYQTRVDLRPTGNDLLVEIEARFDPLTGQAEWIFSAIDPQTGEFTQDPIAGFLPPNNPETHDGEGSVKFRIRPKTGLPSGTAISNMASIIFDWNEPIDTPWITHMIDNESPWSTVDPLPEVLRDPLFVVTWTGSDDTEGSGIRGYDIYVSENDGPYRRWLTETRSHEAVFIGTPGNTYRFYSVATDNVGYVETVPKSAEAMVILVWSNPWHNVIQPMDVNGDGRVTPFDVLVLVAELHTPHYRDPLTGQLPLDLSAQTLPPPYLDVNDDGAVSPFDVLVVVAHLLDMSGHHPGEGEASGELVVLPALAGSEEGELPSYRWPSRLGSQWRQAGNEMYALREFLNAEVSRFDWVADDESIRPFFGLSQQTRFRSDEVIGDESPFFPGPEGLRPDWFDFDDLLGLLVADGGRRKSNA